MSAFEHLSFSDPLKNCALFKMERQKWLWVIGLFLLTLCINYQSRVWVKDAEESIIEIKMCLEKGNSEVLVPCDKSRKQQLQNLTLLNCAHKLYKNLKPPDVTKFNEKKYTKLQKEHNNYFGLESEMTFSRCDEWGCHVLSCEKERPVIEPTALR